MEEAALREEIRRLATDGKVACKSLLDLAHRTLTPPLTLGKLCNDMNIRIRGCQLGCFK